MSTTDSVRLARLDAGDRAALQALLRRLPDDDRRSRFLSTLTDAALDAYVETIDFAAVVTFGAWDAGGRLVAVAEGFPYGAADARRAEVAFATDPAWRRRGLARRLFASVAEAATALGLGAIVARCETRNAPMRSVLRATEAVVEIEPGEVSASWTLPVRAPERRRRPSLSVVAGRRRSDRHADFDRQPLAA